MNSLRALAIALSIFSGTAIAQTKITLGYTAVPDFAAAFVAKEHGFFEKRGLDVQLQLITLTSSIPATLVSNSVQIGGTTPTVFLQATDGGLDLVAIATGTLSENSKTAAVGIVVRPDGGIKDAKDLVGKKVAVPGLNGVLHVLARRWLSQHGVDAKKVTFVETPIPQMPDVLRGGSVDAVVTAEPFITRMKSSNAGVAIPGFTSALPDGVATVLYTANRQWAQSNPQAIQSFRLALADAIAFSEAHKAEAYADLGKYFKVPPPVLQATPWPELASDIQESHIRFWVEAMREQNMLKKQPALPSLISK